MDLNVEFGCTRLLDPPPLGAAGETSVCKGCVGTARAMVLENEHLTRVMVGKHFQANTTLCPLGHLVEGQDFEDSIPLGLPSNI